MSDGVAELTGDLPSPPLPDRRHAEHVAKTSATNVIATPATASFTLG